MRGLFKRTVPRGSYLVATGSTPSVTGKMKPQREGAARAEFGRRTVKCHLGHRGAASGTWNVLAVWQLLERELNVPEVSAPGSICPNNDLVRSVHGVLCDIPCRKEPKGASAGKWTDQQRPLHTSGSPCCTTAWRSVATPSEGGQETTTVCCMIPLR